MASLPLALDPGTPIYRGQRTFSRARLNLPARIVTCTGAKIAAADCPRIGAMVIIEGLPMELFGTVRWLHRGLFGFEFEGPVTYEGVVAMRRHADGEAARQKQAEITYARNWVQGVF
jgi:hypothetical protein